MGWSYNVWTVPLIAKMASVIFKFASTSNVNLPSSTGTLPHSDISQVKGPGQEVQVTGVGSLEKLWPVHQGHGDPQCVPYVGGHLLVAAALAPPLLVQCHQEVTDRLPAGQTQGLDVNQDFPKEVFGMPRLSSCPKQSAWVPHLIVFKFRLTVWHLC